MMRNILHDEHFTTIINFIKNETGIALSRKNNTLSYRAFNFNNESVDENLDHYCCLFEITKNKFTTSYVISRAKSIITAYNYVNMSEFYNLIKTCQYDKAYLLINKHNDKKDNFTLHPEQSAFLRNAVVYTIVVNYVVDGEAHHLQLLHEYITCFSKVKHRLHAIPKCGDNNQHISLMSTLLTLFPDTPLKELGFDLLSSLPKNIRQSFYKKCINNEDKIKHYKDDKTTLFCMLEKRKYSLALEFLKEGGKLYANQCEAEKRFISLSFQNKYNKAILDELLKTNQDVSLVRYGTENILVYYYYQTCINIFIGMVKSGCTINFRKENAHEASTYQNHHYNFYSLYGFYTKQDTAFLNKKNSPCKNQIIVGTINFGKQLRDDYESKLLLLLTAQVRNKLHGLPIELVYFISKCLHPIYQQAALEPVIQKQAKSLVL